MPIQAMVVHQYGDPDVMQWEEIPDVKPGNDELLVAHRAVGVNFIDIFHRIGYYPTDLPMVPGMEGVGVVEEVGKDVRSFKVGDRVAYGTLPLGGYSTKRIVPARFAIKVPDYIDDHSCAAAFAKGLAAHYMLQRTFQVGPGKKILIHAAAGGLGQLLAQWATADGAYVIGTVGSDDKIPHAKKAGCQAVINYVKYPNFSEIVMHLTKGAGVHAVYDGVGAFTLLESLKSLSLLGVMVSIGEVSGPMNNFDVGLLAQRSLFLTRPTLFVYKYDRHELILSASEVFHRLSEGTLKPHIYKSYPLEKAQEAHKTLESRVVVGQQILTI